MSLYLKIPIFIVFLLVFIGWIIASAYIFKKFVTDLLHGKYFWANILAQCLAVVGLFGFVWLLSFFLSIKLILLFILCSYIGSIITGILWRLIGTTDIPWAASGMWTGSELGLKYPWIFPCGTILNTLIFIAYLIVSGIIYFSNPIPSSKATLLIFRYTVIVMYGTSLIVILPSLISTLSSRNLDEDTRLRMLINQGGGLITNALIIALLFWSFEITGKGYNLEVGNISLAISPILILVVFGYFVCTILLPYFIGAQQAKKWRINLTEKNKTWLNKLLEVLEFPNPSQYSPKLEQLQMDLVSEENQLVKNDAMIKLGVDIDAMDTTEVSSAWLERNLIEAYKDSRDYEPRFTYLDFIRHLKDKIAEIFDELEKQKKESEKVNIAKAFAQSYRSKKDEIVKELEVEHKAKPIVSTVIVGLVLAIIVPILNELAKWIWLTFEQKMK